ncbi:MAG: polysaccharide biosynthesis C-terminal domain-containing protein [Blautia marasmi]
MLFVFFIIPKFGILGYLWGLLVSELAITLLTLYFLKDYMKTAPGE